MLDHHLAVANKLLDRLGITTKLTRIFFIDVETRSTVDIKKVGPEVYAAHPSTEIMCASFAVNDEPISRWKETDPYDLLYAAPELSDPTVLCCFHNAEFEPRIFKYCLDLKIPFYRIVDSAAVARHAGLPGALEPLGEFFGQEKDMSGNRTMLKLSKPRRPSSTNPDIFWRPDTKPEDFERMYAYCDRDVFVSRYAMLRMPPLSLFEAQVYAATMSMNDRGIPIDRPMVNLMNQAALQEKARLTHHIERKYGFTLTQVADVAGYLGLKSIAKAPLRDFLKDPYISDEQREVAEHRQLFAKTSLNKLKAFDLRSQVASRVFDGVIYGGAERTLRFSGSGIQPQNLVRGIGERQILAFNALAKGLFETCYDDSIIDTLAGMLRGLIRSLRGLIVGDYAQIEARMLAWLSGDTDMLQAFAEGRDPYRMMAAKIYHKAVDEVNDTERFLGKQAVLGAGYGLGHFGFMNLLDATYDVQIEETESKTIIGAYRKNAPAVVVLWRRIEQAMLFARSNIKKAIKVNDHIGIKFPTKSEMHIILPSGRRLRYYQVEMKGAPNGKMSWSCFGRLKNGAGYGRVKIYGGALTGHVTQSVARDVVCYAMVNLWERDFPLILTVHDELVSINNDRFDEFVEVMETTPPWLTNFPLKVDAFETVRYRK